MAGVDDQVGIISRRIGAADDVDVAKRDSKGDRVVVERADGTDGPREVEAVVEGYDSVLHGDYNWKRVRDSIATSLPRKDKIQFYCSGELH